MPGSSGIKCMSPSILFGGTFLVAAQEKYHGNCVVNHIVDHDAPESHQANGVWHLPGDLFLHTRHLREGEQGFLMFSTRNHLKQCKHIVSHLGVCS